MRFFLQEHLVAHDGLIGDEGFKSAIDRPLFLSGREPKNAACTGATFEELLLRTAGALKGFLAPKPANLAQFEASLIGCSRQDLSIDPKS